MPFHTFSCQRDAGPRTNPPREDLMVAEFRIPSSHEMSISTTAGHQALTEPLPDRGQCGQMYGSVMALEQHLGNTRRTAEVAVYLERRMGIKGLIGASGLPSDDKAGVS